MGNKSLARIWNQMWEKSYGNYGKGIRIVQARFCLDHIHMLVEISSHMSIASFMRYLKSKSSLMIFDRHANLKYKYGSRHFVKGSTSVLAGVFLLWRKMGKNCASGCGLGHIDKRVEISPHGSVLSFVGCLKGKSSLILLDRCTNLNCKWENRILLIQRIVYCLLHTLMLCCVNYMGFSAWRIFSECRKGYEEIQK